LGETTASAPGNAHNRPSTDKGAKGGK
jgi:hypothetical protein